MRPSGSEARGSCPPGPLSLNYPSLQPEDEFDFCFCLYPFIGVVSGRLKAHLLGRLPRLVRQSIRQPLNNADVLQFTVKADCAGDYDRAFNPMMARLAGVLSLNLIKNLWLGFHIPGQRRWRRWRRRQRRDACRPFTGRGRKWRRIRYSPVLSINDVRATSGPGLAHDDQRADHNNKEGDDKNEKQRVRLALSCHRRGIPARSLWGRDRMIRHRGRLVQMSGSGLNNARRRALLTRRQWGAAGAAEATAERPASAGWT